MSDEKIDWFEDDLGKEYGSGAKDARPKAPVEDEKRGQYIKEMLQSLEDERAKEVQALEKELEDATRLLGINFLNGKGVKKQRKALTEKISWLESTIQTLKQMRGSR